MRKLCLAGVVLAACFAGAAYAYPAFRWEASGSNFYIFAKNTDDKAWNCSVSYTLVADNAPQQSFNRSFGVPLKADGWVLHHPTTWTNTQLVGDPKINCN
jgi:hypothetical protein